MAGERANDCEAHIHQAPADFGSVVWKQWKRGRTRFRELRKRNVSQDLAAQTAGSPHGPWRIANSPALAIALPNAYFAKLGLPPMVVRF